MKDTPTINDKLFENRDAVILNTGVNQCNFIFHLTGEDANATYHPINLPDALKIENIPVLVSFELMDATVNCDYVDHPNYDFDTGFVQFENVRIINIIEQ